MVWLKIIAGLITEISCSFSEKYYECDLFLLSPFFCLFLLALEHCFGVPLSRKSKKMTWDIGDISLMSERHFGTWRTLKIWWLKRLLLLSISKTLKNFRLGCSCLNFHWRKKFKVCEEYQVHLNCKTGIYFGESLPIQSPFSLFPSQPHWQLQVALTTCGQVLIFLPIDSATVTRCSSTWSAEEMPDYREKKVKEVHQFFQRNPCSTEHK